MLPEKIQLGPEFDLRVAEMMVKWKVPGCALAVVPLDGEPIILTYGEMSPGRPVDAKTRFPVASCSKLVSALALLKALKTAGYDAPLDVLVKMILPAFKLSDPDATAKCTIRDILAHRCNISPYDFQLSRPFEYGVDSSSLVADLPMLRPLREGPQLYSSIVQQLTYPLIEHLTGQSYRAYVKEAIFDPLGMSATGYSAKEAGDDLAVGYQVRYGEEGLEDRPMALKHGLDGLRLAKLLAYLSRNPHFAEMSIPIPDSQTWTEGRSVLGAGTVSSLIDGHLMSGHDGSCAGFRAHMFYFTSLKLGLGILTNSTEGMHVAAWIEAWIVGSLTGKREEVLERALTRYASAPSVLMIRIESGHATTHKLAVQECSAVTGTGNEQLVGTFHSSSFGILEFTDDCNVPTRPSGRRRNIPWLPHMYGQVRQLITSMGGSKFEGCLGWTPGEGQEQCWGEQYGYPFSVEVVRSGAQGAEEIKVSGMSWMVDGSDGPATLYSRI